MNAKTRRSSDLFLGRVALASALGALMAVPAFGQQGDEGGTDEAVQVSPYGTVTLAVQDTDLAQVLEMLSIQSQKNIITSKSVSATISANLYDVTFYEALDAILKVNGYDYLEEGNFIYIYTQQEMEELKKLQTQKESRIFELNNLSANDANELIAPLLSESGKSSYRGDVQPGIEPDSSDVGQDNWAFTAMLVVNDFPDNLEAIAQLLADLDQAPKQVLIEATILQSTLTEENAFGIDFSVIGDINFSDLTNPLSGVNDLLKGSDGGVQPSDNKAMIGTSTVGNVLDPGTLKVGVLTDDVAVFLRLLDQVSDTTVLARPKIMCLNRQRAEVLVGRRVGYLSTTATETSSTQTVEFLDTGIHLMFRPFISANSMIRLELAPSVSNFVLREVAGNVGSKVTIPDEVTNEITTNVRIHDGHTLVLGGLYRETNDIKRRQVPVLGDIPLVGAAFRGQDDSVTLEEIIFMITPSVVHDELLWKVGDDALSYSSAIQVGARAGLLPFSQQRQTTAYNNRAIEAFNRGDMKQALYEVNNSLRLKPNQPEMIRYRERILGIKQTPFERSILERVFRNELGPIGQYEVDATPDENVPFGFGWNQMTGDAGQGFDTGDSSAIEVDGENVTIEAPTASNATGTEATDDEAMAFDTGAATWDEAGDAATEAEWTRDGAMNADQAATIVQGSASRRVSSSSSWGGSTRVVQPKPADHTVAVTEGSDEIETAWNDAETDWNDAETSWNDNEPAWSDAETSRNDTGTTANGAKTPATGKGFDDLSSLDDLQEIFSTPISHEVGAAFPSDSGTGVAEANVESPERFSETNQFAAADTQHAQAAGSAPSMNGAETTQSAPRVASNFESDEFIDNLLNEYFAGLSMVKLPGRQTPSREYEQFAQPFVTFEDLFQTEIVEVDEIHAPE